jgi:hypothetical protein
MKFPPNNKIRYGQDFRFFMGVPSDVDFTVEFIGKDKSLARLTAPGYGGKPYGNGAIYLYENWSQGLTGYVYELEESEGGEE